MLLIGDPLLLLIVDAPRSLDDVELSPHALLLVTCLSLLLME